MNILIIGGGLQGLCCGYSLYGKGHVVDIVSNELQIVKSKYFHHVYNDVCNHNEDIFDVLKYKHYNVIIPMGDVNVSFLSKNKSKIEEEYGCRCACPDYETLSIVEDKHRFMSFCSENNIPHPQTFVLKDETLLQCAEYVGFPALIKPDFSVGARGITKVNNITELKEKYQTVVNNYGSCTLQEFIHNQDYYYNVMLYRNSQGHFLAYSIIKIVRMYPINAGSSSCCISVENDELLNICKDCLDKLNWVGIADFDVLQRLDNNELKIIEINPRVPASLKAATISGVNIPEVILKDLMGETIPQFIYKTGKVLRYMGLDIMWFLNSTKRFKCKPYWINFLGRDIYYQDIYIDDYSTWWTWFVEGIKKLKKKNRRIR